ncbi:MAG: hypothetical protein ABSH06_18505 [Thermodesulfobacteriota bacterium]|jgi:hypothetical protein
MKNSKHSPKKPKGNHATVTSPEISTPKNTYKSKSKRMYEDDEYFETPILVESSEDPHTSSPSADTEMDPKTAALWAEGITKVINNGTFSRMAKPPKPKTIQEEIERATPENLRAVISKLALTPMLESERSRFINLLSDRMKISKLAIKRDVDYIITQAQVEKLKERLANTKVTEVNVEDLIKGYEQNGNRFSPLTIYDGTLYYGMKVGDERFLFGSNDKIIENDPTAPFTFLRTNFTPNVIKRFRAGEVVSGFDLCKRIENLFSRHIVFKDDRIPTLLSVWVVGTYVYKIFRFYGYLLLQSLSPRCAKSYCLDLLSFVAFNSTSRFIDPSCATLFREVHHNNSTLIIDEANIQIGKDDQNIELIALLHGGFMAGSYIPRVEGEDRQIVYFDGYSPKAFAEIGEAVSSIEDRSFRVPMIRKKKGQKKDRFILQHAEDELQRIREDCYLWSLRRFEDVKKIYDISDGFKEIDGIDDRQRDIFEPLLSIASIMDEEAGTEGDSTYTSLCELAKEMAGVREARESNHDVIAAISILKDFLGDEDKRFVASKAMLERFKEEDELMTIDTGRALARFMKNFELYPHKDSGRVRGYTLRKKMIDDLLERYPKLSTIPSEEAS